MNNYRCSVEIFSRKNEVLNFHLRSGSSFPGPPHPFLCPQMYKRTPSNQMELFPISVNYPGNARNTPKRPQEKKIGLHSKLNQLSTPLHIPLLLTPFPFTSPYPKK